MRVGIFTDTYLPDVNGVVTSIVTLKKALEDNGHEVFVVTNHDDLLKTTFKDNVLRLPGLKLDFLYGYKLTNPIQIAAAKPIRRWNLDIIHVHQEFGVGIFARAIAKAFHIPLVSTYHTTYEDYTHYINFMKSKRVDRVSKRAVGGLSKTFTKKSNIVITPSNKTKQLLVSYGIKNKIEVIPTGIDLDKFKASNVDESKVADIKKKYNLDDSEKAFVYVGRIAKEKSIEVLIEAFALLKDRKVSCKLLIVGDGPDFKLMKFLQEKLNLEKMVKFVGQVNNKDIPAYYHSADAFISASVTETQGLTYIEALASGLAVFARDRDVLSDLIIEDETGYFFDDKRSLSTCIEKFISSDKNYKEKTQKKAQSYSLDNYYQQIIKCYNEAIEVGPNAKNNVDQSNE